jgi:hypothetical protein
MTDLHRANYPVEQFLTEKQIKKHRLQGFTATHSLNAIDNSNKMGLLSPEKIPVEQYLLFRGGKWIVKY